MADIPLTGVEISFPVTTSISNDKIIFESDNGNFNIIQKNAVSKRQEIATLNVRVRLDQFDTFYSFIESNYADGVSVSLNYTGVQPFITNSTNNSVKIVDYTEPVRVSEKFYTMTVRLLKL